MILIFQENIQRKNNILVKNSQVRCSWMRQLNSWKMILGMIPSLCMCLLLLLMIRGWRQKSMKKYTPGKEFWFLKILCLNIRSIMVK